MPALPSAIQTDIPPGFIDLGAGFPAPDLLPRALMQQATAHRFASGDRDFLQYGIEAGAPALRWELAALLGRNYRAANQPAGNDAKLAIDFDSLLVSNGVSQALEMVCTLFTQRGDAIVVEDPTYFLALRIFADHGLRVLAVPVDGEGMQVDALEALLIRERPRLVYTIPAYQNPSGATLSAERRQRLVELAEQYGFIVVADEVYHLLGFQETVVPPLAAWSDSAQVLSLGSFSKILAPGLRLGWVQGHETRLRTLVGCGMLDSGGGLNPFTGAMVQSAMELDLLAPWIASLRSVYAARSLVLANAVTEMLGDVEVIQPEGGYFLWLRLPGVDTALLQQFASQELVGFRAGIRFSPQGKQQDWLRLCHAYYSAPELAEGVHRLVLAVKKYRD